MTDLKRDVQDDHGVKKKPTKENSPGMDREGRSRTAGKDRDFDERESSRNQGHGHPREEHRPQHHRRHNEGTDGD